MTKVRTIKDAPAGPKKPAADLDMSDLEQALGYLLSMAQQYIFRDFQTYFAELELTPNLYSVLVLIEANPGCRQTDIGASLGILQTNLVDRIDALVDRGLVLRESHRNDRRAKTLTLTPTGTAFIRQVQKTHQKMTVDFAKSFGADDHSRLVELLTRLIDCERQRDLPKD